jgi:Phage gp6-like head-tail connector protein
MDFITLEEAKTLLGINDTSKDDWLNLTIPIVEDEIREYCNDDFLENFPVAYKGVLVDMVEYRMGSSKGKASESLSRHSVTYDNNYPKDLMKKLKRRVKW